MPLGPQNHPVKEYGGDRAIPLRHFTTDQLNSAKMKPGSVKVQIEVLNSLFHICGMALGPHSDMLWRKEKSIIEQNNTKLGKRQKWWLVLAASRLWLHRAAGDQDPKIELNTRKIGIVRRKTSYPRRFYHIDLFYPCLSIFARYQQRTIHSAFQLSCKMGAAGFLL